LKPTKTYEQQLPQFRKKPKKLSQATLNNEGFDREEA